MTNLEGRVLRRRRALDPPAGVRSELRDPRRARRRLERPGTWSTEPARGVRRAAPGQRRRPRRLLRHLATTGSTPREALFWPCPDEHHPGTPRLFVDALRRTPDGRARLVAVRAGRPGRRPARRRPGLPGHRPGARSSTSPAPRPAGSRAQRRRAAALRRDAPGAGRAARDRGRRRRRGDVRRAAPMVAPGAHQRRHPAGHRVHAVPLRRRGHGQRRHQRRDRPGLRHA